MMIKYELKVNGDGSILIPSELTKPLNLNSGDQVAVYLDRTELSPEYIDLLIHEGVIWDFDYE